MTKAKTRSKTMAQIPASAPAPTFGGRRILAVKAEVVDPAGFILRNLCVENPETGRRPISITAAFTANGDYIGTQADAIYLCGRLGIQPQLAQPTHGTCSIGFSYKQRRWYGWSHRAIANFGRGSRVRRGEVGYLPKSKGGRGTWTAKTLDDAKQMAIDFARAVS